MTTLPPELVEAYRKAAYEVHAEPPFTLRVDDPSPALASLHAALGVHASAFITAHNPGEELEPAENETRQAALEAHVRRRGFPMIPGVGRDDAGTWAEASVLVLGISREEACALGREYGQNAILHAAEDAVPRLEKLR